MKRRQGAQFFGPSSCATDGKGYTLFEPSFQNCMFKGIGWLEGMELGVASELARYTIPDHLPTSVRRAADSETFAGF